MSHHFFITGSRTIRNDFWRKVLRSATPAQHLLESQKTTISLAELRSTRGVSLSDNQFGQAQIRDLHVPCTTLYSNIGSLAIEMVTDLSPELPTRAHPAPHSLASSPFIEKLHLFHLRILFRGGTHVCI